MKTDRKPIVEKPSTMSREVMLLPPTLSPITVSILPLMKKDGLRDHAFSLYISILTYLKKEHLYHRIVVMFDDKTDTCEKNREFLHITNCPLL